MCLQKYLKYPGKKNKGSSQGAQSLLLATLVVQSKGVYDESRNLTTLHSRQN